MVSISHLILYQGVSPSAVCRIDHMPSEWRMLDKFHSQLAYILMKVNFVYNYEKSSTLGRIMDKTLVIGKNLYLYYKNQMIYSRSTLIHTIRDTLRETVARCGLIHVLIGSARGYGLRTTSFGESLAQGFDESATGFGRSIRYLQ